MSLVKTSCPHCGGVLEVDAEKNKAVCPYCGGTILLEKKEEPVKSTNTRRESPVVAICHDCHRGIRDDEPLHKYERTWTVRSGRTSHHESETYPLCPECYKKQVEKDEAAERARLAAIQREEDHERKVRTFWIIFGSIVIIGLCSFFGYCTAAAGGNFFVGFFVGLLILVVAFIVILFKFIL